MRRIGRADQADRGLAAVDADADVEVLDLPRRANVCGVLLDDGEDAERGERGSLGIVLVCRRDTEEGADAVSHVRLDVAAVLLDRTAHAGDALAHELLHLRGESRSPNDVEPTTSANSAVTGRSSSSAPTAWNAWAEGVSAAPHSGQKRAAGGDSTPHDGQYAMRAIVSRNSSSVEGRRTLPSPHGDDPARWGRSLLPGQARGLLPGHRVVTTDSVHPPELVIADVARVDPNEVADA